MKKQIFIVSAIIITASISGHLYAQEATDALQKTRMKSNNANEMNIVKNSGSCVEKIHITESSCIISFDQEIVSPRDKAIWLSK